MHIPIEGDKIRIKHGASVVEETCFDSQPNPANPPHGRKLSFVTKRQYQNLAQYSLVGADGHEWGAVVESVCAATKSGLNLVVLST